MPLRARKSIRVAKGVRLNLSKTGLGLSVGTKGLRYSVHSSGRHTASAGLPGSGISYQKTWRPQAGGSAGAGGPVVVARPPKPGLFAPSYEKAFHKALQTYAAGDLAGAIAL